MIHYFCRIVEEQKRKEYREKLSEMNKRLENRPFLFQRASQTNAVRTAEGKYLSALKRAGLSEEQIKELLSGQS